MSQISLKSITGITSITTPAGVDNVFTVHTNDTVERFRIDQSGNQSIAGILTVTQDLDVDGHTELDNARIAGVVTFYQGGSEVVRINSGGLLLYNDLSFFGASTHAYWDHSANQFKLNDGTKLSVGSSSDLQIFHDGTANNNVISGHLNSLNIRNYDTNSTDINLSTRNDILLQTAINESAIWCDANAGVHIYHNGAQKFVTTNTGAVISGICTATSFSGDGSNLTGITGTTINSNADNRIITGSGTANTLNGEATLTFTNSGSAGSLNLKRTTSSNQETIFYYGSGGLEIETRESTPIILKTNQQPRLHILSNGGIGVNHSNPRGQFVINSTKNALVNANCNDPQHFHLSLKNEDENNTAIGLCFSHDSTIDRVGAAIIHQRSGNGSVGDMRFYTCASEGTTSERMRITSAGEVCIASSQVNNSAKLNIAANGNHITCKSHNTGGYYSIYFRSANTNVGNIYFNSGGTQYNTGSDYRLKQNIVSLTGAIDRIKTLSPKRFNFISESGVTRDGFLAHEVTTVPEAITGTKDAVSTADDVAVGISTYVGEPIYQTIDQSKLVPLLTAAIQEAIAKIETLETKVAVLEGS